MKQLLIKLKINWFYSLFLLVLYLFFIVSNNIYYTNYKEGFNSFKGIIISINYKEKYNELIIKNKEKILVHTDKNFKIGEYVILKGKFTKPIENGIFNLFNYKKYLMSNKIYYIVETNEIYKIKNSNILYKIKNKIYERINNYKSKDYLKTFILGDKNSLDKDIIKTYQHNGISHLLAISGMHITLLSSLLLIIIKNKHNHFIISVLLIFYAFLTNFTPSVIRAVSLFIFNKNKKKTLIILCFILLIYNPYYIYNLGFLFSFIISFYLITFNNLINKHNNYFIKLFITSLICFIVSIPLVINNFYSINLLMPFFNIIFVPLISIIIFPLSLITLFLPIFDNILFFLINLLEQISLFFNKFSIDLIFKKVNILIIIIYYIIITFILYKPKYYYIFIIILFIHYLNIFKNYNLTMIDIGQGDSILLELKNENILIDTGGIFYSNYDIANNKLIPYFKSLGIRKLDYLIITHGDYDHIGEGIRLVNNFKVDNVIFNNGNYNKLESKLINELENKKIKYYQNINNLKINNIDLKILNTKYYNNENEDSIVIYTVINNHKLLLMGDAGIIKEKDLLKNYNLNNIDILKVGHHGSNSASSKEFINKINPKYCLISAGLNNRYGHPTDKVIDILDDYCKIYRTDLNGSIRINLNKLKIKDAK